MIPKQKISWTDLKEKSLPLRYVVAQDNYYVYANSDTSDYCCVIATDSSDGTDFNDNYKPTATGV